MFDKAQLRGKSLPASMLSDCKYRNFCQEIQKTSEKSGATSCAAFHLVYSSDDAFCRKVLEFKQLAIYRQFFFINLSIRLCFK